MGLARWTAGDGEMAWRIRDATGRRPHSAPSRGGRRALGPPSTPASGQASHLPVVRAKHPPHSPGREAWSEIRDEIEPLVERVLATWDPVLGEDIPLVPGRAIQYHRYKPLSKSAVIDFRDLDC